MKDVLRNDILPIWWLVIMHVCCIANSATLHAGPRIMFEGQGVELRLLHSPG